MDYRLETDGDAIERKWAQAVTATFPNYETFWIRHVVPITWRVQDKNCLYVRSAAPKLLSKLATCNYGTFLHLAQCHEVLTGAKDADTTARELFARVGIYNLYARLASAGDMVEKFLSACAEVVTRYDGQRASTLRARLETHPSGDLFQRYNETFKTRTTDYRDPQIHNWGFPSILGNIPKREHLDSWKDKDLRVLARFLEDEAFNRRLECEFIDAIEQTKNDLRFSEVVINDIWHVCLKELDSIIGCDRYKRAQDKGRTGNIPSRPGSGSVRSVGVSGVA